jgi:hypothetical protein
MGIAPCPLDEESRGLAVGAAHDLTARRIGGTAPDPQLVETARADDPLVQAVVRHEHGSLEAEPVEVVAVGDEPGADLAPARAADPPDLPVAVRLRAERGHQRFERAHVGEVRPERVERGDREMLWASMKPGSSTRSPRLSCDACG